VQKEPSALLHTNSVLPAESRYNPAKLLLAKPMLSSPVRLPCRNAFTPVRCVTVSIRRPQVGGGFAACCKPA
jgi:hypothetical protein